MLLGDASANVQTQTDARVLPGIDVGRPMESVEDVRLVGRGDPDAVIRDGDTDLAGLAPGPDLDFRAAVAVLQAVLDEVVDELLEAPAVIVAGQPTVRLEDDPLLLWTRALGDVPEQIGDVDGLAANLELALLDARCVEQILDERGEPPGLARDPGDGRLVRCELGLAAGAQLEDLRLSEQRR